MGLGGREQSGRVALGVGLSGRGAKWVRAKWEWNKWDLLIGDSLAGRGLYVLQHGQARKRAEACEVRIHKFKSARWEWG